MKMGTLKQIFVGLSLGVFLVLAVGGSASAINSLTVSSVNATASQADLDIPIFITNEEVLRAVICPLMIRKLGGAYVTHAKLDVSERLTNALIDIGFLKHYDGGTIDAVCKVFEVTQPPSPGGFPGTSTWDDNLKHPVAGIPYGIFFARNSLFGAKLEPGEDMTGSCMITVDLNDAEGCFEIDTTCTNPSNHLLFTYEEGTEILPLIPVFAQGVIHVGECQGTAMGEVESASIAPADSSRGPKAMEFSWAPVAEAKAYEFEIDTVDETFSNVWMHRFTQATELTVTLPGDPDVAADVFWRVRAVPWSCDQCFGPWTSPTLYTDVQTIASSGLPVSYTLDQNYPNPFNASTVIQFTSKRDGHVSLEVFNILGQSVVTLLDDFKPVGTYAVTWDGTDSRGQIVPSGMYFYRVSTDDFTAVKKMTLLK